MISIAHRVFREDPKEQAKELGPKRQNIEIETGFTDTVLRCLPVKEKAKEIIYGKHQLPQVRHGK